MPGFLGIRLLEMELDAQILTLDTYPSFIQETEWSVILVSTQWDVRGNAKILPTFRKAINRYRRTVAFGQFDPDLESDLARRINILNVPTILYYQKGELIAALISASQDVSGRINLLINGQKIGYHDGYDFI